jgi:cholera enterotoxin subunit A
MKHFYLLFIIVILSSCSDFEMDEKFLSNTPTNKNRDDNISIDDLLGIWEGTDSMGNLAVFTVDSVSYHLAFKSTITMVSAKDVDIPPTISHKLEPERRDRRQDFLDYGYHYEKPLTFHNPKVQIYANILSGKINSIKYDGDMFYIKYTSDDGTIQELEGTLYPGQNKLHLTLYSDSSINGEMVHDFIFKLKDNRKPNTDRPERDVTDPPAVVYRRDTRDPSDIFANGFSPRGHNNDLVAHVTGVSLYQQSVAPSGWVSTSASLNWVTNPTQPMPNEEFWVYVIIPNSNAYSVVNSFEHFVATTSDTDQSSTINQLITLYQQQHEWAFLGNIPSSNIRRAVRYHFQGGEYRQVETRENPNYNRNIVPSGNPNPYRIFSTIPGFVNRFYRADIRTPDEIREAHGIIQDGVLDDDYQHWGATVDQMNLYLHSRSWERDSYGYLAINNLLLTAHMEGTTRYSVRPYYIYVIAQAPNIFNTSNILGRFSNQQNAFSALGGIPITQIIGWYTVIDGHISGQMTPNENYRESLFTQLNIIDGAAGYGYAGFPIGHNAWLEAPWRGYAPQYCEWPDRAPELKRNVSLSWCEYNTDVKTKATFHELKTKFYTSVYGPR